MHKRATTSTNKYKNKYNSSNNNVKNKYNNGSNKIKKQMQQKR